MFIADILSKYGTYLFFRGRYLSFLAQYNQKIADYTAIHTVRLQSEIIKFPLLSHFDVIHNKDI